MNVQHRQRLAECIAVLTNPSGRSLSANELRIVIRLAMWLQLHDGFTESAAIQAASVWTGSGFNTILAAYKLYWDTGELLEPDSSRRGSGNREHPLHDTSLTLEQVLAIHQLMIDAKLKNEFMPAREIHHRLALPARD